MLAAGAALAAVLLIPFAAYVDGPIGAAIERLPLQRVTAVCRHVSDVAGVLLILAVIWRLDRRRRPTLAVYLVAIAVAMPVNESLKLITGRARPNWGLRMGSGEKAWIEKQLKTRPYITLRPEPRDQWIWTPFQFSYAESPCTSFPSGHANAAFVLAPYLAALYPQGKAIWYAVAVGCGLSRIEEVHHYFTDVVFGSATGWLLAQLAFSWAWPVRLGRRLFQRRP